MLGRTSSVRSVGRFHELGVIKNEQVLKDATMSTIERIHPEQRPPIVLTALDRERLFALLDDTPTTVDKETVCFLREEIDRADIAPDDVAPNSVVRLGFDVKFVDHADARIRRAQLVFPEEAQCNRCISVLSPVGSALIGLGPGQSICWTAQGRERRLAVLEVRASGLDQTIRGETHAEAAARGS
jgi:regulator of nucleoside diphosphate kinase